MVNATQQIRFFIRGIQAMKNWLR